MVYRRRYTRRRNGRSRTLSSYRIATRTSARSQARQIYALNKRISAIQRRTKPEIKVKFFNNPPVTPTFASSNSSYNQFYAVNPNLMGTGETQNDPIDGSFCRQLSCNIYFHSHYTSPSTSNQPVCYRLVGIQTRTTRAEAPNFLDVFTFAQNTSSGFDPNAILNNNEAQTAFNGPLREGLARTAKVLFDRKFYLSFQRPQINATIKLKRLMNWYLNSNINYGNPPESVAKGQIYVFLIAYSQNTTATGYTFDINAKIAYTDA